MRVSLFWTYIRTYFYGLFVTSVELLLGESLFSSLLRGAIAGIPAFFVMVGIEKAINRIKELRSLKNSKGIQPEPPSSRFLQEEAERKFVAREAARNAPMEFSTYTPQKLMAEVEGGTISIDAAEEIGKWLGHVACIDDVIDYANTDTVVAISASLTCTFNRKKWRRKVYEHHNRGDSAMVIGKIASVSAESVSLNECKLVEDCES